ncbi:hypothetical protein Taro_037542, partial [Colocasia esculenta]|nr:hypothetical protein [Colocasia esculenta]
ELIKDLFKKWSSLDETHFLIETVSGGITNLCSGNGIAVLKASIREEKGNDASLTVRLYGPNTDFVIDRKRELKAIRYLSSAGFGAKLLGLFANGMVQSFIDARTLSPPDMSKPKLAAKIARELRKFHQVEIPGSKEPQLWNDIFKFLDKGYFSITMINSFGTAGAIKFDDIEKQTRYESISFEEIHNEITQLKDLTDLLDAPVVFCHNDLLSGNLMLNDDEGQFLPLFFMKFFVYLYCNFLLSDKLYLIDFEYGSYNYRGYDIANHFNEYAGFECDYNLYPDNVSQYHFFRNYLQPEMPEKVTDRDLEALYVETNTFMLASHIYWAIWALIQAKVSPIEFDYLGYFFLRYNEYKTQKEQCFSVAQRYLSVSGLG